MKYVAKNIQKMFPSERKNVDPCLELDACELGSDCISTAEVEGPESVEPRLLLLSVF